MDYTSGPHTVRISTGLTNATFNISINDDIVVERDENFMLTINETSLPTNVTHGTPGEAIVTIANDDGKLFFATISSHVHYDIHIYFDYCLIFSFVLTLLS